MGTIERRKPVMLPLPDAETPRRSKRDTSQWCRGRVGIEHQWQRLNDYMVFCQVCAKQRWQGKEFSLASAVKALREAAGFTQESLAERLRISVERIKEIEHHGYSSRRWIRLETLESIAYVCGANLIVRFERKE